ncbi:MAG: YceD family protein [Gammaproteobacteria bacterium]
MSERLPEFIDPLQLAVERRLLTGVLLLSRMRRLAPLLANTQGTVSIDLEFGQDGQNIKYLLGRISSNLELVCQRCLQPINFSINTQPCLGIVTSQAQAERLPANYEPLLVAAGRIPLATIIEDELLLNLPDIPKHEDENCLDLDKFTKPEPIAEAPRKNPFALLNQLKQKK